MWKRAATLLTIAGSLSNATVSFSAQSDVNDTPLKIWIAPHSHDDAGWLRTVDEYYVYEVQYIIDTVIENLYVNPKRKFMQVEMSFFSRWWQDQDDTMKNVTRSLVKNGQLEFVYGGWVMPDEACPTYDNLIEQLTLGHEFIIREFGRNARPKVGWSIDPFGSSSTLPTLLKQAGFENLVINRIDYRLKDKLFQEKKMEFFWQGSDSLGKEAEMFTHIMDSHYCTPDGFDWEHGVSQSLPEGDGPPVIIREGHEPSQFTKSNALERAKAFVQIAKTRAAGFATKNILIPFGCDFNFQNADMKFKNLDALIETINDHSKELGAVASYSTLSDYFTAVRSDLDSSKFPTYTLDFFPYADGPESYWTGYFTSRPAAKQLNVDGSVALKSAEVFSSWLTGVKDANFDPSVDNLEIAHHAQSLFQHHDGITGTERKDVARDYNVRMTAGMEQSDSVLIDAMKQIQQGFSDGTPRPAPLVDLVFTTDEADVAPALLKGRTVALRIFETNGFGATTQYVRVSGIPRRDIVVRLARTNVLVPFQVTPSTLLERDGPSLDGEITYDLVFQTKDVPAMGFETYLIVPNAASQDQMLGRARSVKVGEALVLANEHIAVRFDAASGLPLQARSRNERSTISKDPYPAWETDLGFSLISYAPSTLSQTSGPYIFRPKSNIPDVLTGLYADNEPVVFEGPLYTEVRSTFGQGKYKTSFKTYNYLPEVEGATMYVEVTSGPLNMDTDLFATIKTDVDSLGKFYTDSNGFEVEERTTIASGRPGDRDAGVSLAGNFYPVTAFAFMKANKAGKPRVSLLTRRSHAVGSVTPGELQIGLHRRFSRDDGRGVGEPLNDVDVVVSQFVIAFSKEDGRAARPIRMLSPQFQYPLGKLFETSGSLAGLAKDVLLRFEPIPFGAIPPSVRLMTFRPLIDGSGEVVARFTNMFETGEDEDYGRSIKVDLERVFSRFGFEAIRERSLTLLQEYLVLPRPSIDRVIELENKSIRTFVIKLAQKA